MASIREKSPGHWQVQIRRSGWPSRNATFKTKSDAQAWARKIEREMDLGILLNQREAEQTRLRDLIHLYLEAVTEHRPGEASRIAERARLKRILRDEKKLCAHAVINLTPEHFEDYRDRRLQYRLKNGKALSGATINKELMLFKQVIGFRMRKLGLASNPANTTDVKRVRVNDERDVRLSPEERARLLQACSEMRNPLLRPFVELGFETGARRGSLLRLEWRDVNLAARTALLRAIKNSRSPDRILNHAVGLTPRAVQVLTELPRTDPRVFPMTANAFKKCFHRARKQAGLEHFRFHDTRHERMSSLFEANWSLIQVMAQSGHWDPKSVRRYANLNATFLADELAKL